MLTLTLLAATPVPPVGSVNVPQMTLTAHVAPGQTDSPLYAVPALAWMLPLVGPVIVVVGALASTVKLLVLLVPVFDDQSLWVAVTLYAPSTSDVGLPDAQSPAATLQLVPERITANVRTTELSDCLRIVTLTVGESPS